MNEAVEYKSTTDELFTSLGSMIPAELSSETAHANAKLQKALGDDIVGFVANRLQLPTDELKIALAAEQVNGVALAIYNIEARGQSMVIGDQTGIGKGRQAAALLRYGMLAGYLPVFLTDRYTLFSDMYRDCKALGIKDARPLIVNTKVSVVDFDKPLDTKPEPAIDEIWSPEEDSDDEAAAGLYARQYEEVYKSPKKAELELMYRAGDIPKGVFEYIMLTYSQLKDARKDITRLDFLSSLCEKHRVLFIFDEAHKSSSVTAGKISVITQSINSILESSPQTQCVFLSATFAKRPECLITFARQTILSLLATNSTLQLAFAIGGIPMQEYVASMLAKEGQMIRREHSGKGIPEATYTYLEDRLILHAELFDKAMYWFREIVKLSDMVKELLDEASLMDVEGFRPYPTRSQLFYVNKILLLALKARDVAEAAVREVQNGRSVVIGMSDTLECVLRDSLDENGGKCTKGDFSRILLRLLDKTLSNPNVSGMTIFDLIPTDTVITQEFLTKKNEIHAYAEKIRKGISDDVFHLPMSPIDVIRQLITQERFTDAKGVERAIRFEECTGRARQLEYLSPEGDDAFENATLSTRKKRHSNLIYNDFQNNKLDVILINACGAIGASAHAIATAEVPEKEVRQRKMLIVQNDLDVNIDLQKRGRINRTGQIEGLPPLYEYIITAIPSEKRLNMMLRAKLRSLSANTTANQDQDRRQADFIDITNKYGNLVTQEYISDNPELAFVLGLKPKATATQLLARVAMLSVSAQQEIIDEIFSAYQSKEQELRRINQWDLEREHHDFEAQFVRDELFTAPIDNTVMGGASMLSTYLCRHRTYPYDSSAIYRYIENARDSHYGQNLSESDVLRKDIRRYYQTAENTIRGKFEARKARLFETTYADLLKCELESDDAQELILMVQRPLELWRNIVEDRIKGCRQSKRINRKLELYNKNFEDLETRQTKALADKAEERKRLLEVTSDAVIGQGYSNIINALPVEEKVGSLFAVLKEVRFGKTLNELFKPGKVQFVFALSAVHKEIILNLVGKGKQSNYGRLITILSSSKWTFNGQKWDMEISKYNNRILERKIITGNILGAYCNPIINKIKPHFITFTLAPDADGRSRIERGLLLPMTGENIEKLNSTVSLPLADGLKYANSANVVYPITGTGVDFSLIPRRTSDKQLVFCISVNDKDSRNFEADYRYDTIRHWFQASPVKSIYNKEDKPPKQKLLRYATPLISADAIEFVECMTLLASQRAVIMIPRQYLTVGAMKGFACSTMADEKSNWPELDWQNSAILPPVRKELQIRITAPVDRNANVTIVEEYSPEILLCQRTLPMQGQKLSDSSIRGQLTALYLEWKKYRGQCGPTPSGNTIDESVRKLSVGIMDDIHRLLVNPSKDPTIRFNDRIFRNLKDLVGSVELSAVGKIKARFREEMLFLAPRKDIVESFLDSCPYDYRLADIRQSLENYLSGKTEIIIDK